MEYDDVVLPVNVFRADEATGTLLCSNDLEVGVRYGVYGLLAESADLLNRRIGHINRKKRGFSAETGGSMASRTTEI